MLFIAAMTGFWHCPVRQLEQLAASMPLVAEMERFSRLGKVYNVAFKKFLNRQLPIIVVETGNRFNGWISDLRFYETRELDGFFSVKLVLGSQDRVVYDMMTTRKNDSCKDAGSGWVT